LRVIIQSGSPEVALGRRRVFLDRSFDVFAIWALESK
jgi:hypothetical protein